MLMKSVRISNVRIIDRDKDVLGEVLIKDGDILGVYTSKSDMDFGRAEIEIDGRGKILMPSFVDLHTHFRDPGFTAKEDIKTGSEAAVKGGFTTVCTMANTSPICDNMDVFEYQVENARKVGLVDLFPVMAITKGLEGNSMDHLYYVDERVKLVSDDGRGLMNSYFMEEVLELSKDKNFIVCSHAEDTAFSKHDMRKAENYMSLRDIYASMQTGGRLHLCHVSTKEVIDMIRKARQQDANVTCEVAPHHLYFTDDRYYRVNPPFRKKEDISAIIKAIKEGYVDVIATDHAPHTEFDKENGAPGISGIETAFAAVNTVFMKNRIDLRTLSKLMSYNPAHMLGLKKGLVSKDYKADLVLVDIDKVNTIKKEDFASKNSNSPFIGEKLFGEVLLTIKAGEIVYKKN